MNLRRVGEFGSGVALAVSLWSSPTRAQATPLASSLVKEASKSEGTAASQGEVGREGDANSAPEPTESRQAGGDTPVGAEPKSALDATASEETRPLVASLDELKVPTLEEVEEAVARALKGGACDVHEVRWFKGRFHAACGAGGVWVLRQMSADEPAANKHATLIRSELGVFLVESRYKSVFSVVSFEERLAAIAQYSVLVSPNQLDSETTRPEGAVEARVVQVDENRIVVQWIGEGEAAVGARVRFSLEDTEVVGEVIETHHGRSVVEIGLAEARPGLGSYAESTVDPPSSSAGRPEPRPFSQEAGIVLRVGADLTNDLPFAGAELWGVQKWRQLRIQLQTGPFVLSRGARTASAALGVGYVSGHFGLNAWGGVAQVNYAPPEYPGVAPVFGVGAHIGYDDGVRLGGRALFTVFREVLLLAETRVHLDLPLTRRFRLLLRGAHGRTGVSSVELGLNYLMLGDGRGGSLFLEGAAGGLLTFRSENGRIYGNDPDTWGAGPIVAIGASYRF